ncbi:prephenate dehydrogenase/arogenate dehydrogenase family protein [Microbacter margulisiae]|uniref:Prephenate dehydrogenase n=1 Tax=Microbacter margulisiae TaxID=1350067 RepID=A0A7W5DSN8_9PORP|nr:prephenate dehydrogenase/arogenate dehydrogenase family protein [Microbacter margulisiae]MBB3188040.1 prephenate dehydrogenase [Microbacter margulisiae]
MRILILGAGKMGSFFADVLSFQHEVALYDADPKRLRFVYNTIRMSQLEEVSSFDPELVINAVTIKHTLKAFRDVIPFLSKECLLSDIASVKTGLPDFYANSGFRFVSTHPMFGPTFASLSDLSSQSAIIIAESDPQGKLFFRELYGSLKLSIFEYSFQEHDQTTAYSLAIPFASTLIFGAVMKHQEAPGTTFKRHLNIAHGLLSEDDYLLTEILFNPYTPQQLVNIRDQLSELLTIIEKKDSKKMQAFLQKIRENIA